MKRLYHYPVMLILTILSVICLIVFEITAFAQFVLFQPDIYSEAIVRSRVSEIIYNDLVDYFTGFSGPTGIPAQIFIEPLDKDELGDAAYQLTVDSLTYLTNSNAAPPKINYDFSHVEQYVDSYIEQYTEYNGFEKDENYYNLIKNTNSVIESQITGQLDVSMLYKLSQTDYANVMRGYAGYVSMGVYVSGAALFFMVLLMIVVDRRHPRDLPYWFGVVLAASSVILLVPAAYLQKINYFDNFFIRSDNVYRTVTGLCKVILNRIINTQTVILVIGIFLILLTIVIHMIYLNYLRNKRDNER